MLVMMLRDIRSLIRIPALLLVVLFGLTLLAGFPIKSISGMQTGDFLISVSPSRLTIGRDGIGRYSVRATSVDGFAGTIQLRLTDLSPVSSDIKISFSFEPSVLQLAVDSDVYSVLTMTGVVPSYQYGYYYYANLYSVEFKITATGGGITKSTPAAADLLYGDPSYVAVAEVAINAQPNIILTSGDISQGRSQAVKITITSKSPQSPGQLLFTTTPQFYDPPNGLYVSFKPMSVDVRAGQSSELTADILMTPEFLEKSGTNRFAIGISGLVSGILFGGTYYYQDVFITKTAIVTIVVPPYFNVAAKPSILNVYIGGEDQKLEIVVTPVSRGLNQPITLSVDGIPPGVVASFERDTLIPRGKEPLSTNLLLNAPSTTKPGVFPIRISATTLGTTRVTNASLYLRPSGDYSLRLDQAIVSLSARGESRSVTLTVIPQGDFRSTIEFSVTNVPRGVTATLSTVSATVQMETPVNIVLTLTASPDAQAGTYDLSIVANTGFSTKTISVTLLVRVGTVEIWPVVLIIVILIAVVTAIVFVGIPRGRRGRVVLEMRRLPP